MTAPPNPIAPKPCRGGLFSVLGWIVYGFLIYLLASGPIARLSVAGYLPMGAVNTLYQPLVMIAPDGRKRPVRALVLDELLPMARQGLRMQGVSASESERWLEIVEQRVRSGCTGSAWHRAWIRRHGRDFQRMLADYLEHQRSHAPVHEWPA